MSRGLRHTNRGRQRGLLITLLLIAAAVSDGFHVIPPSHAFEFTGERWEQPIEYHYLLGCPAYVMPAIENAFAAVSPIPFSNSGPRSSVGYDQKVTIYCAAAPIASQIQLPESVALDETQRRLRA